jgi:3D (Asp-Asp-Asp) domain-containing protein
MKKHRIGLLIIMIAISVVMGGLIAYAQTEAREELCGYDNGSGGKNYRTGRALSKVEIAEYNASAPKGKFAEATCERPYVPSDSVLSTFHGFGGESLGHFKITAYTAGFESCGKPPDDPLYGITAMGTRVKENYTIASDWDFLPPGTKVAIEGIPHIFTVEDRGGAVRGKHIDIYIEDLDEALKWGVRDREVWLINE